MLKQSMLVALRNNVLRCVTNANTAFANIKRHKMQSKAVVVKQ